MMTLPVQLLQKVNDMIREIVVDQLDTVEKRVQHYQKHVQVCTNAFVQQGKHVVQNLFDNQGYIAQFEHFLQVNSRRNGRTDGKQFYMNPKFRQWYIPSKCVQDKMKNKHLQDLE